MPLPHNLFDYCSIRKSNFIEKYLVVKRKISFVYKADILLTKLIIRGVSIMEIGEYKATIYDDVWRTIVHDFPNLLIAFVNELFSESYNKDVRVEFL